jgi:hypothetical protein
MNLVRLLSHTAFFAQAARAMASGNLLSLAIRSNTRRTRNPPSAGSTSIAGHSRVQSSTMVNIRITFPLLTQSGEKESKLSYNGNLLVENRNGLIVDAEVFVANGTAKRDAALIMLQKIPGTRPVTVGGDKGFDTDGFVAECRNLQVVPHVAQNLQRRGGSAIDGCTMRLWVCHQPEKKETNRGMLEADRVRESGDLRTATSHSIGGGGERTAALFTVSM